MKPFFLAILLVATSAFADPAEKRRVSIGAFVDTYYAFDLNQPAGDRAFTTQAIRHNELSINLAYVDVKLDEEHIRGRLALQAGTSVYANYSGERATNSDLGNIVQHLQEAYMGYRLWEYLWLDAGVFFSHIGAESFISKDNVNYTRSLGADFSPYYQAGVRLSYQRNPKWSSSLHVINGWQNIIDNNADKAIGMQLAYAPSDAISFTYNNFIGNEGALRIFNNLILRAKPSPHFSLTFSSDIGFQSSSQWYVETFLAQQQITETVALGGRLEYFHDNDQIVVTTGTPDGFDAWGGSLNVDWRPEPHLFFRAEIRSLYAKTAVFPGQSGQSRTMTQVVSSLAMSF